MFLLIVIVNSKLQSDALREAISQIVTNSKERNRNFTETIELQIGLKNYDPQKDKRFSGSVKLPHIPRPKMKICMLGDAQHVEEVIIAYWHYIPFSTDANLSCHLHLLDIVSSYFN